MPVELNQIITTVLLLVEILLLIILVVIILSLIRYIYSAYLQFNQTKTVLELTPPAHKDSSVTANQELFNSLYGLGKSNGFLGKLLGKSSTFSVEISSTKKAGIRFFIIVPDSQAASVEQFLSAHTPDTKVMHVSEYLQTGQIRILSFKQSSSFIYPLKSHEQLESHDPIGYIASAMTKLNENEQITMQLVCSPASERKVSSVKSKILRNESVLVKSGSGKTKIMSILQLISKGLFGVADLISNAQAPHETSYSKTSSERELEYKQQQARNDKPARTLSYFENELIKSVSNKLDYPLFKANLRVVISVSDKKRRKKYKESFSSAFSLYNVPKYQGLKVKRRLGISAKLLQVYTQRRMLTVASPASYFATTELASLFHFPHSESARTDNVVKSFSKTLPAPVSLKDGSELDIIFGANIHHGEHTPIGLTKAERERHMYIIGGTGNGKTTMLKYQIIQDIVKGNGVAVIDPHGDLASDILGYIPKERIKDVIYLNPDDLSRPIGINLLELPKGLTGDELLREKDIVTESTISVLRKIFSEDDSGGHRIEYVLRNTIQTALTMNEANLFTIFRLLNDTKFRRQAVATLEDSDLINFWKNELGKAGDFQKVKMAAGITAKIGRFLFSASAKRILEQTQSTINFDQIMDEKKILICNFSKGTLGEDTSMLFGVTILAKLQLASLRRARQSQADRSSYYLYVDEFQNFATMSFVQMLSEARKYKLFLTMAEQSTQQQEDVRLVDIILANVGTVVAFRSGSPADERLILPLFSPYIEPGEIANLPAYNFYARITAIKPQEPMSGVTKLLEHAASKLTASNTVKYSRQKYGRKPIGSVNKPTKKRVPQSKTTTVKKVKNFELPIKEIV